MIKNPKYKKNKTNKGNIPTLPDRRVEYVPIGCGNCMECRKQKSREWQARLLEDIKTNTNGKFITLTFSNESINELLTHEITKTNKETGKIEKTILSDLKGYEKDNQIATRATRLFNERWRKKSKWNPEGKAIRHWLITELGHNGTENIHLHGIIWTNEHVDRIREIWKYGWIWPRPKYTGRYYVNAQTVNYIIKYVHKTDAKHKEYKPIILTSPGIGANYVNTLAANQNINKQTETYRTSTGHQIALPIYWRNKLFTEHDKETLWIKKLDKQERWVLGVKYDISKTTEHYDKAVQEARRINTELKYGTPKNENRKKYEEQKREIMIETRIKNIKKKE